MTRTTIALAGMLAGIACGGAALHGASDGGGNGGGATENAVTIKLEASRWSYSPSTVSLQRGVPVKLELTSNDVHHGFNVPGLGLRADIMPGETTTLNFTPKKAGTFLFHCDYYCGSGHEEMTGQIIVQ